MSALYAVLSFLLLLLEGFLLISLFWNKEKSIFSDLPLKCSLSVGFGFAVSSCLAFLWMIVVGRLTRGVLICELLLLAGLCLVLLLQQTRSSVQSEVPDWDAATSSQSSPYLLRGAFCLAFTLAAVRFFYTTRQYPHGQYDAFAIRNLRARFLLRGAQYWKQFTHATADSHIDYPLLLPASIARSWQIIGRETQLVPALIALLFTFATIGLATASLSRLRGERQGLLAGLVLLGTPFLISHGASQYADVPAGFFFLATIVLLFLHTESPSTNNFLILAGMAASASAWTKNEGILFLVLLFCLYPAIAALTKGTKQCGAELLALLKGTAPIGAVILIYKFWFATRNDLVAAQENGATVGRLLDLSRYRVVLHSFLSTPLTFGRWSTLTAMPVLLVFYFLLLGASIKKKDLPAASIAVFLPHFMLVGYFFVYVLSPWDLEWHLGSSFDRLLLQLWPLVVFTYFVLVQTPEEASVTEPL